MDTSPDRPSDTRDDRERWNAKHARRAGEAPEAPDAFFEAALTRLGPPPPGSGARALDAACGRGRHALHLARAGWRVEAWDVSDVALGELERLARLAGHPVTVRRVDLLAPAEAGHAETASFDLVVVVSWFDRRAWPRLLELVAPGGALLFTTFTTDRPEPRPRDEWCLRPGELRAGLEGFETLHHEERDGRAGLLARRAP